jgi:hypothetical protein
MTLNKEFFQGLDTSPEELKYKATITNNGNQEGIIGHDNKEEFQDLLSEAFNTYEVNYKNGYHKNGETTYSQDGVFIRVNYEVKI